MNHNQRETHIYSGIGSGILNVSVDPFGNNSIGKSAYRKAERLSLATYLVTNFVPAREYIREKIRTLACELLDATIALRMGLRSAGGTSVEDLESIVRKILSHLDNAHAAGYISDMNLSVLKQAYITFGAFLRNTQDADGAESLALSDAYFTEAPQQPATHSPHSTQPSPARATKKSLTDKKVMSVRNVHDNLMDTSRTKDNSHGQALGSNGENTAKNNNLPLKKKRDDRGRRQEVLAALAAKHTTDFNEIAQELPHMGERTIRRELNKLVDEGILVREGVKRWTTYTLR